MQKFEPIVVKKIVDDSDHYNYHHFGLSEARSKEIVDIMMDDCRKFMAQMEHQLIDFKHEAMSGIERLKATRGKGLGSKEGKEALNNVLDLVKKLTDTSDIPCDLDLVDVRLGDNTFKTVNEALYYMYLFGRESNKLVDHLKNHTPSLLDDLDTDIEDDNDDDDFEFGLSDIHTQELNDALKQKYRTADRLLNAPQHELVLEAERILRLKRGDILKIKLQKIGGGIAFDIKLKSGVRVQ